MVSLIVGRLFIFLGDYHFVHSGLIRMHGGNGTDTEEGAHPLPFRPPPSPCRVLIYALSLPPPFYPFRKDVSKFFSYLCLPSTCKTTQKLRTTLEKINREQLKWKWCLGRRVNEGQTSTLRDGTAPVITVAPCLKIIWSSFDPIKCTLSFHSDLIAEFF